MSFGPELITAIRGALNKDVLPARINKIETGESWAAFKLGSLRGQWLLFSWNPASYGCGLADDRSVSILKKTRPSRSSFGEALKRNFSNGALLSARQINSDRVLHFAAERVVGAGFTVKLTLVFEGTDRNSNLIILDERGVILEPAKHIGGDVNRYRMIIPGAPYIPPPPLKGRRLEEVGEIKKTGDLDGLIGVGRGLSKLIKSNWDLYSPEEWNAMIKALLEGGGRSLLLQRHGGLLTVFPKKLPGGEFPDGSLLGWCGEEILSSYFGERRRVILAGVKKGLEREIKSRMRRRDGLENQRKLSERGSEFLKMGNLLISAGNSVPSNVPEVSLTDWESGELLAIPLDPALSVFANAEKYFKKFKKGKVDIGALAREIESIDDGIAELREQLEALEYIDDPDLLSASALDLLEWVGQAKGRAPGKKKAAPPHIRLENGQDLIYAGLNARGNRHVTFKVASPGDLWFHAHETPGAHVILKSQQPPEESSLLIAASLAAWYSRARDGVKVQVDYTERKHVRSIPGSAIAHVTYSNPRTLLVSPRLWKEFPEVARSVQLEEER